MSDNLSDLGQFCGSSTFYRHHFNRQVIYTEGCDYLTENGAGAAWLVDAIASHIGSPEFNKAAKKDSRIPLMHIWNLSVNDDGSCLLSAKVDSGEPNFIEQQIPYTDFPLETIDIWSCHNGEQHVLMLPNEY